MATKDYMNFIKETYEKDGMEITNDLNHRALENKVITLAQFQKAAHFLVEKRLSED